MINQYDLLAKITEATAEAPLRKYFEDFTFFKALGDIAGCSVLDVACGTGLYSRRIKQRGAGRVVGLDSSEGMIDYARYQERQAPLGIEYVVRDAAAAGELGTFDVVTATYLLHYAPSVEQMRGMCATLRRAMAPGGRLVSICLNPEARVTEPAYYRPYGFELRSRGQEGDEAHLVSAIPEMPFSITAWHWSRHTYEAALQSAGFRNIVWCAPEIAPEGLAAFGEAYWRDYLRFPHAAVFTCTA
ncbi:ubiquinone/menaquinone biosynthesis C-methylase UbiE [Archangium gephyra]|uniref:Methyltransferase n=1 Tax=Archangium gephyra TaxID=48 RepID=A0AAC8QE10_9BACT|nr:class I SAM-dependent methyltransferase [Archangium gephyra]AKJ05513.1 Methyltransferase [Archangium gephyra]REG36195.1 ubiquinone/menaquinone biosynthesis C-methylase UbiE [Archangium gephyra]